MNENESGCAVWGMTLWGWFRTLKIIATAIEQMSSIWVHCNRQCLRNWYIFKWVIWLRMRAYQTLNQIPAETNTKAEWIYCRLYRIVTLIPRRNLVFAVFKMMTNEEFFRFFGANLCERTLAFRHIHSTSIRFCYCVVWILWSL